MQWKNLFDDLFSAVHLLGVLGLLLMLFRRDLRQYFERHCVGHATAEDLAYVRIVVCSVLLLYTFTEDLASHARLGPAFGGPPGYFAHLGRREFDWFLSSAGRLDALTWALRGLLVAGILGLFTRIALIAVGLTYLWYAALLRCTGKEFHEAYLVWYVELLLCLLPCADRWSLDARFVQPLMRRKPDVPKAASVYGWAVWACYAAACVPYLQLAFSKLAYGGPYWFDGRSLRNVMLTDNLNLTEWNIDLALRFHDAPLFLFTAAGLFALLLELAYPLVLLFPRLRWPLGASVSAIHLGVWFGQDAMFFDAIWLPVLIFLLPSTWRRKKV